jgi:16S rRNA (cytosine967-C5)-methyltransferase
MKLGARIQSAIDVLHDVLDRHRPASAALADWGKAHRFAGSGDRAAIGNIVFDALRWQASAAYVTGDRSARGTVIGALHVQGLDLDAITALFNGETHAPSPLTTAEQERLRTVRMDQAPPWTQGNYPEWLHPSLSRVFGNRTIAEGQSLARRAPVDVRVNALKASRETVLESMALYGATTTPHAGFGIRLSPPEGSKRQPNVEADAGHGRGWFEVQDEGSQIAAAMTGVKPGDRVLDLCAGAGGKTLAMAAAMKNIGRIFAYDADKTRLRPIFERMQRAGVDIIDVMTAGDHSALAGLGANFDVVLVDAPCSGTGTWRRKPDAKWRLKPDGLKVRRTEQAGVLALAARHVKPGGRLVYVTCSLLPEENGDQIAAFVAAYPTFAVTPWREVWKGAFGQSPTIASADGGDGPLMLTPRQHGTDGFFIAVMTRHT